MSDWLAVVSRCNNIASDAMTGTGHVMVGAVTRDWVKRVAETYAERLFEATESL